MPRSVFNMKKKNFFITGLIAVLAFLFVWSFVPKNRGKNLVRLSLVSENAFDRFYFIQLVLNGTELSFEKDGIWWIYENGGKVPANQERLELLWKELSKKRDYNLLEKDAASSKSKEYYFEDGNTFSISWLDFDGNSEEIVFGKSDFAGTSRTLCYGNRIYQVSGFNENVLSTSFQYWCEGEILSKEIKVLEAKNVQNAFLNGKTVDLESEIITKLFNLRYSGSLPEGNYAEKDKLVLYFGNGSEVVITGLDIGSEYNYGLRINIDGIEYLASVSVWTYEKIFLNE